MEHEFPFGTFRSKTTGLPVQMFPCYRKLLAGMTQKSCPIYFPTGFHGIFPGGGGGGGGVGVCGGGGGAGGGGGGGGGGVALGISGWGCATGTLVEPLTYTTASSVRFCHPILEQTPQVPPILE